MNRAQMEHYNILKPSLERFGKCQWNIKVYKRNRGIAASCEDFPEAEDIFIPDRVGKEVLIPYCGYFPDFLFVSDLIKCNIFNYIN